MEKNGEYCGRVSGYGTDGEGIIKTEGTTAFVPFCLEDESVEFRALKVKGNIAYGKLTKVLTPSPERRKAPCPVYEKCGGCDIQHMSYAAQLKFKKGLVGNALSKLGGIYVPINDVVPCESEFRYRNKLALPVGTDENGNCVCGFYAPRSHRIVPISDCLIQSEWIKDVICAVKQFAKGRAEVRHIVARKVGESYIFALVCTVKIDVAPLICLIERKFESFTFLLNVNDSQSNVILGKEWHICRGEGVLQAQEQGVKYAVGANTFAQVNDDVRKKLYDAVLAQADENCVAVDLYSGGGLLTAMLAKKCGRAYGIEIVEEASRCADELKERNGLQGKMFNICGAVEDNLGVIAKSKNSLIVCDPPRKGMERSVAYAIRDSGADKVVLVSCNPATLARDLGIILGTLTEVNGNLVKCENPQSPYCVSSVTPFDMFPQTKHVETLVVLSHKKPDSHIEVKIDMDDTTLDTVAISERAEQRKPKDKPTYKKMQAWIEENYGFKVHTGYIAEVKRNEGLPMYDAPNAVEELKHPRPHPTPQMVEAIKAALKHFEII